MNDELTFVFVRTFDEKSAPKKNVALMDMIIVFCPSAVTSRLN